MLVALTEFLYSYNPLVKNRVYTFIPTSPAMKTPLYVLLLIGCFVHAGCERVSTTPINPVVTECVGTSSYFIDNQSSYNLSVAFTLTKELGSKTDSLQTVNSKQRKQLTQDASFGYIPKPVDTFTSLVLSRVISEQKVIVYKQDPIVNTRWIKVRKNPNDPDYGCNAVTHTLTVTNDDLN